MKGMLDGKTGKLTENTGRQNSTQEYKGPET